MRRGGNPRHTDRGFKKKPINKANPSRPHGRKSKGKRPRHDQTPWMKDVMNKLQKSGLPLEQKFRDFPLEVDGKSMHFVPDFKLSHIKRGSKFVIIQINETLTRGDVRKYASFLNKYGGIYHLIMIVKDEQLRNWNSYDDREGIFHDVWTEDGVGFLVDALGSPPYERFMPDDKPGPGFDRPKAARPTGWEPCKVHCPGCSSAFTPGHPSQPYCNTCMKKFEPA